MPSRVSAGDESGPERGLLQTSMRKRGLPRFLIAMGCPTSVVVPVCRRRELASECPMELAFTGVSERNTVIKDDVMGRR